jgi:hypothetical protein
MKTRVFAVCVVVFLFCGSTLAGLSDGLVAYSPFKGNANDESGNGNNGIVHGATLTDDRFGNANSAYYFDGVNDLIDCGDPINGSLDFGTNVDFSISLWIKTTMIPTGDTWPEIICKDTWPSTPRIGYEILLELKGQGRISSSILTGPVGGCNLFSDRLMNDNRWHHVVSIRSGTSTLMYIDGTLEGSRQCSNSNLSSNAKLIIGNHETYFYSLIPFQGNIDDILIYNRALSAFEIQELYAGYVQPTCYDTGYLAGVAACQANPAACGINVNPGTAVMLTPDLKMHLPNIQYSTILGPMSIWTDLAYDGTKTDGSYFKVTGAGAN